MTLQFSRCCLLWVLLVNIGCSTPRTTPQVPHIEAGSNSGPQQASEATTGSTPKGLFDEDPKGAAAWQQFTEDGRYRMAKRDDFQIPEAAVKEHPDNPFFTNKFAYVGGDFNRDGHYLDRAFIVVDTTVSSKERFGVVIFSASADDSVPKAYWLFRGRDLSRTVLGTASELLYLTEYQEDGTYDVCHVLWNKDGQNYFCQKNH
jgi:hypothetical protein